MRRTSGSVQVARRLPSSRGNGVGELRRRGSRAVVNERIRQTREELEQHLLEQIRFLRSSASAFDAGDRGEAKRLAVVMRVLLHDGPSPKSKTRSLLTQLGVLKQWSFLDSAGQTDVRNLASTNNLVYQRLTSSPDSFSYEPVLDEWRELAIAQPGLRLPGSRLPFERWWRMVVVRSPTEGLSFSRADLVLGTADTDGGAHVDASITYAHHKLTRGNALGWFAFSGDEPLPVTDPVPATLRQIAFEIDDTIRHHRPDLDEMS